MGLLQVVTEELQVGQPRHHAQHRRQVEEVVETDRGDDGGQEQQHDTLRAPFHRNDFVAGRGFGVGHRHLHDRSRDQEIDYRGNKQQEKTPEVDCSLGRLDFLLPDHQGGDVTERAEGAAGIGGDHHVDAAEADETRIVRTHGHDHGAHQQGGGQVVGYRRDEERQPACDPEQGAVAEALADQPGAQGIEYLALVHGIDIGHGSQQKQEQFRVFHQVVADVFPRCVSVAGVAVGYGYQ